MVVRADGRTYADLVKEVKGKVNTEELGIVVERVRKTGKGDLSLTVTGGGEKAELLTKQLGGEGKGLTATVVRNWEEFRVLDVEPSTTGEEVRDSVARAVGVDVGNVEFRFDGKAWSDGNRVVVVAVAPECVQRLSELGRVKVGWTRLRVRQMVRPIRCYRCHGFGHVRAECKGKDRTASCYRCGGTGHRAKECRGEPHCASCDAKGHRAESTACPVYKALLEEGKKGLGKGRTALLNDVGTA